MRTHTNTLTELTLNFRLQKALRHIIAEKSDLAGRVVLKKTHY